MKEIIIEGGEKPMIFKMGEQEEQKKEEIKEEEK